MKKINIFKLLLLTFIFLSFKNNNSFTLIREFPYEVFVVLEEGESNRTLNKNSWFFTGNGFLMSKDEKKDMAVKSDYIVLDARGTGEAAAYHAKFDTRKFDYTKEELNSPNLLVFLKMVNGQLAFTVQRSAGERKERKEKGTAEEFQRLIPEKED